MAVRRTARRGQPEESHDFFISMTDMMVGMIFLFIIMLMFFALKLERAASQSSNLVASLTTTEEIRADVLTTLKMDMAQQGVAVQIYPQQGVLSLPENILFDKGKADLSPRGEAAITVLANALYAHLSCFSGFADGAAAGAITVAPLAGGAAPRCPETNKHSIEAVLIEGHTDSDGNDVANWNLSVKRSFSTYQFMITANPDLGRLVNRNQQTIFSISGYGKQRPVRPNDSDENKHKNRRVDLRLIMEPPSAVDVGVAP